MAQLLVSVRSGAEAKAAADAGAHIIDVKEPVRGPLGRADRSVWADVLAAVSAATPVSVALGELSEWLGPNPPCPGDWGRLSFRKLGLAGVGPRWEEDWARLRRELGDGPKWVAVVYADWQAAAAPCPDRVLDAAFETEECAGVLFDTWDKASASPIDGSWRHFFDRARRARRFTALAGRVDLAALTRLSPLRADLIAVRGAACFGGDRLSAIDPARVAELVRRTAEF